MYYPLTNQVVPSAAIARRPGIGQKLQDASSLDEFATPRHKV